MTKVMTSMLAATLAGLMVLTVAAPNALAFERGQRQQQMGQQQGFRQRLGQGVQKWAQQRWQGLQSGKARLSSSLGGFYQAVGSIIAGVNFYFMGQALHAGDHNQAIISGVAGGVATLFVLGDMISDSGRSRRY